MVITDTEHADLPTPSGAMRVYVLRPADVQGKPRRKYPGLVLFSEIFQVTGGGLVPVASRHSVLGTHTWYQQTYRGLPVLGGFYATHTDTASGQTTVQDGRLEVGGSPAEFGYPWFDDLRRDPALGPRLAVPAMASACGSLTP